MNSVAATMDKDTAATNDVAVVDPKPSDQHHVAVTPRAIVWTSAALAGVSLVLMALSIGGVSASLPVGLRAAIVCLVAVTLPGLPVAALLKLPANGIFASVTVAISLATNLLLSQLNIVAGIRQPYLAHGLLLLTAIGATAILARRGNARADQPTIPGLVAFGRAQLPRLREHRVGIAALAVSMVLFGSAIVRMHTEEAGRLGLLGVLGVDYFAGLALLAVVFAIEYRRGTISPVMLATANTVLLVYVTMPVAWADRTAPFPTAYTHRNIMNWVSDLGVLPPPVDARMSWAGFFSAGAQLMKIGGITDSDVFLVSASLVFGILLIFPVYAIGLAISQDTKLAWLSVTIYILFNWYQQDYFAPQAVAMQLYATILAILLWQLRLADVPDLVGGRVKRIFSASLRTPGRVPGRGRRWTESIELVLVLIIASMVVSHQLTPLVTIAALVLFAALGLTRYKLLWLAAVLIFVSWFVYGAGDFWQGHLGEIISDIGGLDKNINSSVAGRISGDPGYDRMQYLRISASILLFATAGIGWLRMPRGRFRPIAAALSLVPFGLILVQSYGGEVAIRCFVYASPILAPLAAMAVAPFLRRASAPARLVWLTPTVVTALVFFGLSVLVTTNRGLNTSFEQSSHEVLSVTDQLKNQVDTTRLTAWGQGLSYVLPGGIDLDDECFVSASALADCTAHTEAAYVVLTDQDFKYVEYKYGFHPNDIRRTIDILDSAKGFQMMYNGDQVMVLKRIGAPALRLKVGP
jgi:hypothetical protein